MIMNKMSKNTIKISLATMLLGLLSCSTEESVDNIVNSDVLRINTNIAPTRSIIEGTNFSEGDKVQLSISGAVNSVYNAEATLSEGSWTISPKVVLGRQRAGVSGYANLTDTIAPDETGNQNDILFGVSTLSDGYAVNWQNPVANMQFYHLLSRVTFELRQANGSNRLKQVSLVNVEKGRAINTRIPTYTIRNYAEEFSLGISQIGLIVGKEYTTEEKAKAQAEYDAYVTSVLGQIEASLMPSYYGNPSSLTKKVDEQLSENPVSVSLLVLPTIISSYDHVQLQVVLEVNEVDKVYAIEIPEIVWNSNKHYKYPVSIDLSSDKLVPLSIGDVSIEKWGTPKTLDGKVIDTYMD